MFQRKTLIALCLLLCLLVPGALSLAQDLPDFVTLIETDDVMRHVSALSVDIGARVAGTDAEVDAADYIAAEFEAMGYEVEYQDFEFSVSAEEEEDTINTEEAPPTQEAEWVESQNVIATLPGDDEQMIIIGAHYDSVDAATGAGDNASGVAVILAAAEALAEYETTHTLVFVAFGAEETGLNGSSEYVMGLGRNVQNVIAMINIDSVGMGTNLNVYAGAVVTWGGGNEDAPTIDGGPVWVRDLALDLAAEMNLPFGTSPDSSWGGYTGDWSDHYPFVQAGIPVAYFEAWQWEGEESPWWGQETEEGDLMHTEDDVYESVVPDKVEMTAEVVAATAYAIANDMAGAE